MNGHILLIIRIKVKKDIVWQDRIIAFRKIGKSILKELRLNSPVYYADLAGEDITEATMRVVGLKKEKALSLLREALPNVFENWNSPDISIEEVEISFDHNGEEIDEVVSNSLSPA